MTANSAPRRDDDPAHPNFDGIIFYATTDRAGIVATPQTGQQKPVVSYLPLPVAVATSAQIASLISTIRHADAASYLADFLEDMLEDLTAAIEACRPEPPNV